MLSRATVGFHAPPKNRGRLIVPASELAKRFDKMQKSELRQRFLRLGIARYVGISAVLFGAYLAPQLLSM